MMINLDNKTDKKGAKMIYLTIQFSDQGKRAYNFATARLAIRFLSDLNSREFQPVLLSDVKDVDVHEWLSDFIMTDNNRVLEYNNPDLIGKRHAEYRTMMFNRIGRSASPIK